VGQRTHDMMKKEYKKEDRIYIELQLLVH